MNSRLTIGLSLALSGAYAAMGRQAEAGLRLFISDCNAGGGVRLGGKHYEVALNCDDDQSDPARCAAIYRSLCLENRADLVFGPYSSRLTRAAAPVAEQTGFVIVNHGGAADDLHEPKPRMMVSVLSPASDYLRGFARLLSTLKFFRKRAAIVAARTAFARAVAHGFEQACSERIARLHGVRIRLRYNGAIDPANPPDHLMRAIRRNRINALASAGGFAHDVAVIRTMTRAGVNLPVLACVAAGLNRFGTELGEDAQGIVGPSQWEESVESQPELGPRPAEFARRMRAAGHFEFDYPAAQAYAAGLLTREALRAAGTLNQSGLRAAFGELRTTTLYGGFAIDRMSGRQIGHRMLLVQWHDGHKIVIDPEPATGAGALEFPSGWRLILASFQILRLRRREEKADEED